MRRKQIASFVTAVLTDTPTPRRTRAEIRAIAEHRRNIICSWLCAAPGAATVAHLAGALEVSESTIRSIHRRYCRQNHPVNAR